MPFGMRLRIWVGEKLDPNRGELIFFIGSTDVTGCAEFDEAKTIGLTRDARLAASAGPSLIIPSQLNEIREFQLLERKYRFGSRK